MKRGRFRFGRVTSWAAVLLLLATGIALVGLRNARAGPVVRRMTLKLPGWPAGARSMRVLLWSDVHLGNLATDPDRLRRLAAQANALHPDLIVLGGDYIAGHKREDAAVAPQLAVLGRLRAPAGVVAVMGNHEYWTNARRVRRILLGAGITVLTNGAVRRGPLVIGGLDDMVNHRANVRATIAAMRALGGVPLLVSHSPDIAPRLPQDFHLLLAGHTHCGQIVLPGYGPLAEVSRPRYRCGPVREAGRLTVVTAGTGTSILPLRYGAPPDWWQLTLGP